MNPIGRLGEYEIILTIKNIGSDLLKDFIVKDLLPEKFSITESDFTYYIKEMESINSRRYHHIKFIINKKIGPGEKKEIKYKVKGKGDYHPKDLQQTI